MYEEGPITSADWNEHYRKECQRLAARVAHLEKYAGCRWTCDSRILSDDDATKRKGLPCTCGFQFADRGCHEP